MAVNEVFFTELKNELDSKNVRLIAVSKIQSVEDIKKMYDLGQRDFGENYVQELVEKQAVLPADIRWHFIGHLQSNKVKQIVPFVHLVQGVDSLKLLLEINKQGKKAGTVVNCLLQLHITDELTKYGMDKKEADEVVTLITTKPEQFTNVCINGLMGMASFSDDLQKVRRELQSLKTLFDTYVSLSASNFNLQTLSMGMSGDYKIAIEEGSNMVRIGSLLFGARIKN